jgi:hypothetical protein
MKRVETVLVEILMFSTTNFRGHEKPRCSDRRFAVFSLGGPKKILDQMKLTFSPRWQLLLSFGKEIDVRTKNLDDPAATSIA